MQTSSHSRRERRGATSWRRGDEMGGGRRGGEVESARDSERGRPMKATEALLDSQQALWHSDAPQRCRGHGGGFMALVLFGLPVQGAVFPSKCASVV